MQSTCLTSDRSVFTGSAVTQEGSGEELESRARDHLTFHHDTPTSILAQLAMVDSTRWWNPPSTASSYISLSCRGNMPTRLIRCLTASFAGPRALATPSTPMRRL